MSDTPLPATSGAPSVGGVSAELLADIQQHADLLVQWARDQQMPNYAKDVERDFQALVGALHSASRASGVEATPDILPTSPSAGAETPENPPGPAPRDTTP